MDQFPQMIFRAPGAEEHHGIQCDSRIVNDVDELERALDDGWRESPAQAEAHRLEVVEQLQAEIAVKEAEAKRLADEEAERAAAAVNEAEAKRLEADKGAPSASASPAPAPVSRRSGAR